MSAEHTQGIDTRTLTILAFSATAGTLVELYDFFIYGYAAASAFPGIFFPKRPPTQALVFSFLAFGAGFPPRLVGAFIFGHFGDRAGRKFSFLLSIAIVGATSSLLAEFGAQRRSRAFWMSLANLGIPLGGLAASGVMLVMSRSFATTGWRVAMLLSVVIVIPALLARYKLADSPLFERLKQREELAALPSFGVFKMHAGPIFLVALVVAFMSMDGFVMGTYFISFMKFVGIPLATTAVILMLGRVADALGVLLSGPLADLCKRRMAAYIAIGMTTLLSYPFVLAVLSRRIALVMTLQIPISFFGIGVLHGLGPILASESFSTKFRYSGTGISYDLCHIFGGMLAPSVLAGLIGEDVFHKWYYVPICYALYGFVAMLALLFMRETRDVSLQDLDQAESGLAIAAGLSKAVPD